MPNIEEEAASMEGSRVQEAGEDEGLEDDVLFVSNELLTRLWLGVTLAVGAFLFWWLWSLRLALVLARSYCPSRGHFPGFHVGPPPHWVGFARNHATATWACTRAAVGSFHRRCVAGVCQFAKWNFSSSSIS